MSVLQFSQILMDQKPVLVPGNDPGRPPLLVISFLISIILKHTEGSREIKLKSALFLANNPGKLLTPLAKMKFGYSLWISIIWTVLVSIDNQQFTA